MFCANCGAQIQDGSRFCSGCGKPVAVSNCPACSTPIKPDNAFCTNCGNNLKGQVPNAPPVPAVPAGIASDLKDLAPNEAVLMDSGHFPISYVKNLMTSINGKLYLTNLRLVFKAGVARGGGSSFRGNIYAEP
jgi:predicted nucleic acid-binding Zn ribbon protein